MDDFKIIFINNLVATKKIINFIIINIIKVNININNHTNFKTISIIKVINTKFNVNFINNLNIIVIGIIKLMAKIFNISFMVIN